MAEAYYNDSKHEKSPGIALTTYHYLRTQNIL